VRQNFIMAQEPPQKAAKTGVFNPKTTFFAHPHLIERFQAESSLEPSPNF
jgi:hypothetical protein